MKEHQNRKLAAILFADIIGYTALMQRDEQSASALLRHFQKQLEQEVANHNGRIVNFYGDGALCTFQIPLDALGCAMALQTTFQNTPNIPVRIGIHSGTVTLEGDKIFGDSVNITSRIESMGVAGGILFSKKVRDDIKNNPDLEMKSLGSFEFKNVEETIEVFALANEGFVVPDPKKIQGKRRRKSIPAKNTIGLLAISLLLVALFITYQFSSSATKERRQATRPDMAKVEKSIAVLPFKNDSPDAENQYFCDGMMDEILNHLQKIRELGVKSRTGVEPYRNSDKSIATIAQELGVHFILEGAVRKYNDKFRVTTQLIEVTSGNHLWSETYDGIFSDTIFTVQGNIAKKIASSMRVVISPKEVAKIDQIPTHDLRAYDYYIKAVYELNKYWLDFDKNRLSTVNHLFNEALRIDPEYFDAIVRKGGVFLAQRDFESAIETAERAIAIDPENHEGYQLLGECARLSGQPDLAKEHYLKAISKADEAIWSHVVLSQIYLGDNEPVKAFAYLKKGLQLEEDALPSVYFWHAIAYLYIADFENAEIYAQKFMKSAAPGCYYLYRYGQLQLLKGEPEAAIRYADTLCLDNACEWHCYLLLIEAYMVLEDYEKVEQTYLQLENSKATPDSRIPFSKYQMGYVYDQMGKTAEANAIFTAEIKRLKSISEEKSVNHLHLSRIQAYQGNTTAALENLSKYVEYGGALAEFHRYIFIDPFFKNLQHDPSFEAIVKEVQEKKASLREQVSEMELTGE